MLESYSTLREKIDNKNRERKNKLKICNSPEMWADRYGEDIRVHYASGWQVATLHPDNSMEITFGDWYTPTTVNIIKEFSGRGRARLYMSHIWFDNMPTENGKICFDEHRRHIPPARFVALKSRVLIRCQQVSLANLTPPQRLQYELRSKDPIPAITQKVKDYALGKIGLDRLSVRDIWTCMNHSGAVAERCMEAVIRSSRLPRC